MSAWRPNTAKVAAFILVYALSGLPMWIGTLTGARRFQSSLGTLLWVGTIPLFLLLLPRLARWVGIDGFSGIGLRRHPRWSFDLAVGFAFGLVEVVAILVLQWSSGAFTLTGLKPISPFLLVIPLLNYAYVALSEELVHRGFLAKLLPRSLSPTWVSVITAAFFTLVHYRGGGFGSERMASLFLAGLIYMAVTLVTGSLWMAIGMHWSYNILNPLLIETGLVVEKVWLDGSTWGSWAGVVVRAALLVALPLVLRRLIRQKEPGETMVA